MYNSDECPRRLKVISLGTGSKCLPASKISKTGKNLTVYVASFIGNLTH